VWKSSWLGKQYVQFLERMTDVEFFCHLNIKIGWRTIGMCTFFIFIERTKHPSLPTVCLSLIIFYRFSCSLSRRCAWLRSGTHLPFLPSSCCSVEMSVTKWRHCTLYRDVTVVAASVRRTYSGLSKKFIFFWKHLRGFSILSRILWPLVRKSVVWNTHLIFYR
jgi:hypothetical protein